MINTFLSYFCIDIPLFSYIAGISLIPLVFLYVSSYVFRFCEYHRMFLHYIVMNNTISYLDYKIGIPVTNRDLLLIHVFTVGIYLFLILYLYVKHN
jgi:hypothetical protein